MSPQAQSQSDALRPADAVALPGGMERQVFDCLSFGIILFDEHFTTVYHNAAARWLVTEHSDIVAALRVTVVDSRYEDWQSALHTAFTDRRETRFEQVLFRVDGTSDQLFNLTCLPWTDSADHLVGGILVLEDVTERAGLEKRLAVSERMAAVGKLSARVAHELNNPLDGILRYLNLAVRAFEIRQTERLADYLKQARGGLLRMRDIIRELVEFSRSNRTTCDETGINAAIEEAVKVMSDKAAAAGVSVVCRFQEDMPATRGSDLFQVFCNLVKNAIDAMPDGGTLTILTQMVAGDAVIQFEDTGVGLPDQIDRLFEPFFTTKAPGKGTGLGLAICRDIVEKHNGTITPRHRPGGGAVFTIRIPQRAAIRQGEARECGTTIRGRTDDRSLTHE